MKLLWGVVRHLTFLSHIADALYFTQSGQKSEHLALFAVLYRYLILIFMYLASRKKWVFALYFDYSPHQLQALSTSLLGIEPLQDINAAFFDLLFDSDVVQRPVNPLEQQLADEVSVLLASDAPLGTEVSILPTILTRLINTIKNPGVDFIKVVTELCDDPDIAKDIIVIANSKMYNPNNREINTIDHATAIIGLVSVSFIASTVLMSHVMQRKPTYFESFSQLIWKHSLLSAMACRDLAHQRNVNSFCCHLLGLVNNVGMVHLFNKLNQTLNDSGLTESPHPEIYQTLMKQHGSAATLLIAHQWELPEIVIDALTQQSEAEQTGFGEVLYLGSLLGKVSLLVERDKMSRQAGIELLVSYDLPEDYVGMYLDMAEGV
ncbi:MAG: HD-like signal output (HDOD) protein [Phenylobacterium sp.]|jgi:HD-like signal output (HDOD) protein